MINKKKILYDQTKYLCLNFICTRAQTSRRNAYCLKNWASVQIRSFTKNNLWSNICIHWCLLIYTMIYEYICKIACLMVKEQSWKTDRVLHLGKHPIHIFIERFSVSYNTASFAISLLNVYFLPFHPLFFCPYY